MRVTNSPWRVAGIVIIGMIVLGIPVGILWSLIAPSAADIHGEPQLAIAADAIFGLVTICTGVISALVVARMQRRNGIALIVGVVVGGLCGSVVALGVGVLLGQAEVRALPVLLAWSVGGLISLVALGVSYGLESETDPAEHNSPEAPEAPEAPELDGDDQS